MDSPLQQPSPACSEQPEEALWGLLAANPQGFSSGSHQHQHQQQQGGHSQLSQLSGPRSKPRRPLVANLVNPRRLLVANLVNPLNQQEVCLGPRPCPPPQERTYLEQPNPLNLTLAKVLH